MELIQHIIETFIPSATLLGVMVFLVLVSIGSKIGSGIYKNVMTFNQPWDWKVFGLGILKGLIFGLSIFGVALVVSGVPIVLSEAGMFTDAFAEALSNSAMLALLATACVINLKAAYDNYRATLGVTPEQIKEYSEESPAPDAGSEG